MGCRFSPVVLSTPPRSLSHSLSLSILLQIFVLVHHTPAVVVCVSETESRWYILSMWCALCRKKNRRKIIFFFTSHLVAAILIFPPFMAHLWWECRGLHFSSIIIIILQSATVYTSLCRKHNKSSFYSSSFPLSKWLPSCSKGAGLWLRNVPHPLLDISKNVVLVTSRAHTWRNPNAEGRFGKRFAFVHLHVSRDNAII